MEVVAKKGEKKPEENKAKNFIVIPAEAAAVVECADEKAAARAIAQASGYAGKLLVVEADYVELLTAHHRIELKTESMDKFVEEGTQEKPNGEENGDPDQ